MQFSERAKLAATAVISGSTVACLIFAFQALRRQERVDELKASIPPEDAIHHATQLSEYGSGSLVTKLSKEDERSVVLATRARMGDYDEELILEQLARNRVFLRDDGLAKVRKAFVIVVGCGGVGSHAAAALARSGVNKIRLIDFDQVTLSSLNRHALATLVDVGTPKVHCIQRRLEAIAPWVHFDCRNELFSAKTAAAQLGPWHGGGSHSAPDYIIDAIDNIDSKVALLKYCHEHSLPVISSMGAGCKSDPTRLFVGDISTSTEDPLSRQTRRRLRASGVTSGVACVYSTEKPGPGKASLLPLAEEEFAKGSVGDLGVLPDFRVRILPVLGTMPAIFGMTVANHVLLSISGYPHEYVTAKGREKTYESIHASLQGSEERLARSRGLDWLGLRLPLSVEDVGYLVDEVFRGKSVVSALSTRLALVRWKKPEEGYIEYSVEGQKCAELKAQDVVLMTKDEATKHEKLVLLGVASVEEIYGPAILETVGHRKEEEKAFAIFR